MIEVLDLVFSSTCLIITAQLNEGPEGFFLSGKVPGTTKQVSYEWMGPIGDWLSLTVDVVDNFDSLSSGIQEDLFNKSRHI